MEKHFLYKEEEERKPANGRAKGACGETEICYTNDVTSKGSGGKMYKSMEHTTRSSRIPQWRVFLDKLSHISSPATYAPLGDVSRGQRYPVETLLLFFLRRISIVSFNVNHVCHGLYTHNPRQSLTISFHTNTFLKIQVTIITLNVPHTKK
jgi:hypothetical protein